MVIKTDNEGALLAASKQFDEALAKRDLAPLTDLLADDVVLHQDAVTLNHDLRGRRIVIKYFQSYVDRYNYEHVPIAGAVDKDEDNGVAFSLSVDKGVVPKENVYKGQHQAGQAVATDTAAIYHFRFNSSGKIKDIFFLRQLSVDEANRKMKTVPDMKDLDFDPEKLRGQQGDKSEERAQRHQKAADIYNQMWHTGDASAAPDIMADNVQLRNVVYGSKQTGVDSFQSMISTIFKDWHPLDHEATVAVTAGNKAFVWWRVTGEYQGDWSNNYGLSLLVFDDNDKIAEVNTFMQPFPKQRRELINETS
eukprot:jgi/Botrbrau1/8514/Bobra.0029s0018.1